MSNQVEVSRGMTSSYRAFEINDTNMVVSSVNIRAASDKEAVHQVFRLARGQSWEVWDRNRFIIRLPGRDADEA